MVAARGPPESRRNFAARPGFRPATAKASGTVLVSIREEGRDEMRAESTTRPRIGVAAAALVGLLVAVLVATLAFAARPDAAAAQTRACPNAKAPATDLSRKALRRTVTCLINNLRRNRGRDPVRRDARLQRVAQRHSRVMVRTSCLKHRCPGQPPLQRRLRRSGYLDGARRWRFAQSTGCARSAMAMVRKWRQSRFHRSNLLGPRLRDIGVGVVGRPAVQRCNPNAATFTALLAWRRP